MREHFLDFAILDGAVRDLAVLFLHLLATVARLAGPGGARSVIAESVLVKHQLLILNRSEKRSPNLRFSDQQGRGEAHSHRAVPAAGTRRGWAVMAHGPRPQEGQFVES